MHKSYAWNRYELLYSILNFLFGISNIFFPVSKKIDWKIVKVEQVLLDKA